MLRQLDSLKQRLIKKPYQMIKAMCLRNETFFYFLDRVAPSLMCFTNVLKAFVYTLFIFVRKRNKKTNIVLFYACEFFFARNFSASASAS